MKILLHQQEKLHNFQIAIWRNKNLYVLIGLQSSYCKQVDDYDDDNDEDWRPSPAIRRKVYDKDDDEDEVEDFKHVVPVGKAYQIVVLSIGIILAELFLGGPLSKVCRIDTISNQNDPMQRRV